MKAYLDLLKEVIETGRSRGDRTGTGTVGIFDAKLKYNLSKGEFPLLTTRFIPRKAIFWEYMSILKGELHLESLTENNIGFWDPWRLENDATKEVQLKNHERLTLLTVTQPELLPEWNGMRFVTPEEIEAGHAWLDSKGIRRSRNVVVAAAGDLNAPYGPGWRNFSDNPVRKQGVDQIAYILNLLKNNPDSRRILLSAWNPLWMPEESKEVKLTNDEMWAYLKENDPGLYDVFWNRLSDMSTTDNSETFLASHGVPTHKTVKVTPQENIIDGKPCLTPCHWAVEFYVEDMSTQERLDWCSANANPYFQDIWEDHMSDVYAEENCGQPKMSAQRKAEWLTENRVPTQWLSLKWHQRSVDYMVGEPFNQAFYAYMLLSFAHEVGMAAHTLVGDLTNVHVYSDHIDAAKLQLSRVPMKPVECFIRDESLYNSSVKKKGLFELEFEDFVFTKYEHHPAIELKPSV